MSALRHVWSYLAADPVQPDGVVRDVPALLGALELDPDPSAAVIPVADGVTLVHAHAAARSRAALHWVRLSPPAPFPGAAGPAAVAIVLETSPEDTGLALHVATRVLATFADPHARAGARGCASRDALLHVLEPIEARAGDVALTGRDVLSILRTGEAGLTSVTAARRLRACGPNRLERVRHRPLVLGWIEQMVTLFALLLWVAGGLAMVAGMPELGWTIFAVIVLNAAFSFFQEYRAERALEAIERLLPRHTRVVRDGRDAQVELETLVPGDIVRLDEGDQVPADGQVIAADLLRLEQSSLTGEPHAVFKTPATAREVTHAPPEERPERVFAGTGIVSGAGVVVVTATGMNTRIGGIARLTQSVGDKPSPLVREVAAMTRVVTVVAIVLGTASFALSLAFGRLGAREGFLFGLGMIVANVPEGLLPVLTLALALGVQRMARLKSVVKRLSSVETLGAVSVICTDKTGTLTENRMVLRHVHVDGRTLDFPGAADDDGVRALLECAALASVATLDHGDPTERALVVAARDAGIEVEALRASRPVHAPLPFDSFRKRMTLVRRTPAGLRACVKGAPRGVLERCDSIRTREGTRPIADADRAALLAAHDGLAAAGHRMLAVAERRLDACPAHPATEAIETRLTLLGLGALWDPPRTDVTEAVALCRRAGIRVIMVTGDDGLTARAIAERIRLPARRVVLGDEVGRLSPATLRDVAMSTGVLFARMSPEHKLAVVQALRSTGAVVAVTGDGVNDAPALRAADVGVAMGRRGSEVAKEAAEMVITDDHFASIVAAVREGRSIYSNIGRFMRYVLASNVPEIVPFLAFVFLRVPLPLTVMQILAVDLGTDIVPALGLGAEPPEPGVMDEPPRPRHERLLSAKRLALAYGFLGLAEALLCLLGFFWVYWVSGWRPGMSMAAGGELYARATTMTFAGIVATQIGNVFACRTERESVFRVGLTRNRLVLWGIATEVALLLLLVLVPPLARFFGFAPLAPREWSLLLAFPPLILGMDEARKAWLRRRGPRNAPPPERGAAIAPRA